jgi:D-glycero-D-manno-heptose 1,7-bisphosphate phosphatase
VQALRKAAFLDRDGVINVDRAYVSRWENFEFVPGVVEACVRSNMQASRW